MRAVTGMSEYQKKEIAVVIANFPIRVAGFEKRANNSDNGDVVLFFSFLFFSSLFFYGVNARFCSSDRCSPFVSSFHIPVLRYRKLDRGLRCAGSRISSTRVVSIEHYFWPHRKVTAQCPRIIPSSSIRHRWESRLARARDFIRQSGAHRA